MNRARWNLAWLLLLVAVCLLVAHPPIPRDWILAHVSARLGVSLSLEGVEGHGLLTGLHLHGLSVAPAGEPGEPFLRVEVLRIRSGKGSLWKPDLVILERPHLTLKFDAAGKLTTRLPEPSAESARPNIILRDSSLTLIQEGRAPWTLAGIGGQLVPVAGGYRLEASVADHALGSWTAEGRLLDSPAGLELEARSDRARLHAPDLERLPFIAKATWDHVTLEGTARCGLKAKVLGHKSEVLLELSDPDLRVSVAVVGLSCQVNRGHAVIQPGLVKLDGLGGEGLGGGLAAPEITLDFRKPEPRLEFAISASNLDGHSLASLANSRVARNLKVFGTVAFSATITGLGPVFEGRGNGEVRAGPIPLRWKLASEGGHLQFIGPFGIRFSTRR